VPTDFELAMELADVARGIAMQRFRAADLAVVSKADGSPVTDADREIERSLRERLAAQRPGHAITGEEFGDSAGEDGDSGDSEWRWYLDPIDGTASFIEGSDNWKVLIALVQGDRPVLAVVDGPAQSSRWWAVRGEGAFRDGQRLHVSSTGSLAEATISDNWEHTLAKGIIEHPLARLAARCGSVRPNRGDTFLQLAAGELDVAVGLGGFGWDYAPLMLIVEEAGGRFTDHSGRAGFDHREALVSNGAVHAEAIRVLADGAV
jgi:histidinol-phosphatase